MMEVAGVPAIRLPLILLYRQLPPFDCLNSPEDQRMVFVVACVCVLFVFICPVENKGLAGVTPAANTLRPSAVAVQG